MPEVEGYGFNLTPQSGGIQITILDSAGLPASCACGQPATGSWTNTLGKTTYYCAAHDPAGGPCPLCGGSGKLPPK